MVIFPVVVANFKAFASLTSVVKFEAPLIADILTVPLAVDARTNRHDLVADESVPKRNPRYPFGISNFFCVVDAVSFVNTTFPLAKLLFITRQTLQPFSKWPMSFQNPCCF